MRFWFGGPRIFGMRTGVSFNPKDFRKRERSHDASSAPKSEAGSFIYVIAGDHGLVKVGVSSNPLARMAQLRTASPFNLRFAFVGAVSGDAYRVEAAAHELLGRQRLEGEWFDVAPELAMSAVMGGAAKLGLTLRPTDPNAIDVAAHDRVGILTEAEAIPRNAYRPIWLYCLISTATMIPFWMIFRSTMGDVAPVYWTACAGTFAAFALLKVMSGASAFRQIYRWAFVVLVGSFMAGLITPSAKTPAPPLPQSHPPTDPH